MDISSYINTSHIKYLKEITKPLFDLLNISYFEFYRVYEDGGRIILSTSPEWDIHFFKKKYFECTPFEGGSNLYKSGYKLWDLCPATDQSNILANKDARDNYDFDHGLSILKIHQGYMDLFELATTHGNTSVNPIYLTEMDSLEKFVQYFLKEFSPIIDQLSKNKIYLPCSSNDLFVKEDAMFQVDSQTNSFNQFLNKNYNIFYIDGKRIKLSKREMQCLKGIIKGKSAKKIAKELMISHRTIEIYIEKLKIKTGIQDRSELIEVMLSHIEIKNIII